MAEQFPVIILPGIGQSRVQVIDESGNAVRDAWPISADAEKLMGPLKGPLMKMMLFRRDGGFSDAAARVVASLAEDLTSYPDGSTKYPLKADRWEFPLSEYDPKQRAYLNRMVPAERLAKAVGEENVFFFAYNSFGDAYQIAGELDSYIQQVKARTGSEQVHLMAVSLGGVLLLAYLDAFGKKGDVKRVVNVVAALGGTHLASDILEANFDLSDPKQLLHAMGKSTEETFSGLLDMLPEGVAEATLEKCAEALSETIAINSTMMWGTVPRDRYVFLKQKYLLDGDHAHIAADADRLHKIHVNQKEFFQPFIDAGLEIFSLCGYGKRLFPLCGSGEVLSDGIVDTASASLGAVCAIPGEALPEGYEPQNPAEENALSPDGCVDASACLYPQRTWFFANQGHDAMGGNDAALKLISRICSDDSFTGVASDPAFPRFNGTRNVKRMEREAAPAFFAINKETLSEEKRALYDTLLARYQAWEVQTVLDKDAQEETDKLCWDLQHFAESV